MFCEKKKWEEEKHFLTHRENKQSGLNRLSIWKHENLKVQK